MPQAGQAIGMLCKQQLKLGENLSLEALALKEVSQQSSPRSAFKINTRL